MIRRDLKAVGCVLTLLVAGCSDGEFVTARSELAIDGPWVPAPEIVEKAAGYDISFVGAGRWVGTSGCSPGFTAGGAAIRQWLYDNWPQVEHVGGYACRAINGDSSTMSVHATGRAVDIHIPLIGGAADNELGDPLANWLLDHAEEIGIQSIIWDRWIWSPSRSPRSRPYTGAHSHNNHLHVELTPAASRLETPWFLGEMGPPTVSGCDEPLPAEGGVIDDSNACFQAFGPSQYWRREDGNGVEGGLRWTNAFETETSSNWARWRINLSEGGTYRVQYHSVATFAVFDSTHYAVKFGEQTEDVYVDQGAGGDGWVDLGTWDFAAGPEQWVAVYDDHAGPVGDDQHVIADAIRLLPPGMEGEIDDRVIPDETPPAEVPPGNEVVNFEQPDDERPAVIRGEGGCSAVRSDGSSWGLLAVIALVAARRRRD